MAYFSLHNTLAVGRIPPEAPPDGTFSTLSLKPWLTVPPSPYHEDQRIKLWDFETGRLLAEEHGHCKSVLSLAFSADGWTLVSGGEDAVVMVWRVDARK